MELAQDCRARPQVRQSQAIPETCKIMPNLLYLWREERDTHLSPAEIQRRLDAD